MVYYSYTTMQTYNSYTNNSSQYRNWNNNNGYTAMQYANQWYPGWSAFSYRWDNINHCWKIYMRHDNQYRTVWMNYNYSWRNVQNGYCW